MEEVVSGDMKCRATALVFPQAPGQQRNFKIPCLRWMSVVTPDGTGTPSGTWDTDSSAGWWDAVLGSTGAVPSSPQAPQT